MILGSWVVNVAMIATAPRDVWEETTSLEGRARSSAGMISIARGHPPASIKRVGYVCSPVAMTRIVDLDTSARTSIAKALAARALSASIDNRQAPEKIGHRTIYTDM